jgi:large subunit ribosomal protein L34e
MVAGKYRSKTLRKVFRKTPGGRVSLLYKKRKPQKGKCAKCGALLHGVARAIPTRMSNIPKSKKRPTRPFGGNLCSKCMRFNIKAKTRK